MTLEFKKCGSCKLKKKLTEFFNCSQSKSGLKCYCKKCFKKKSKEYYLKNSALIKIRSKEWYRKNKKRKDSTSRNYNKNNKEKMKKYYTKYVKNRLKSDFQFKLIRNLRIRLRNALKRNEKKGSAIKNLGCSIKDFKLYLEYHFQPGMTWDNYGNGLGKWNIDHIKPLSKFDLTDKVQLLEACNYKNLQPMWHIDNIKKGNK